MISTDLTNRATVSVPEIERVIRALFNALKAMPDVQQTVIGHALCVMLVTGFSPDSIRTQMDYYLDQIKSMGTAPRPSESN